LSCWFTVLASRLKHRGINSYSNLSWFLEAKHGCYYRDGWSYDLRDPVIRFEECDCEVCKGLMPQEIIDLMLEDKEQGFKTLALHNLLDMKRSLAGGS
jgi:queuine/archaeosine tRNA-ribosyltransferase